jgi:hypothetical protein
MPARRSWVSTPQRGAPRLRPIMSAQCFNTLKFANRLKAAGIAPAHAEAEAQALAELFEVDLAGLATKVDLREQELRLTIKFGAMLVVAVGVLVALLRVGN